MTIEKTSTARTHGIWNVLRPLAAIALTLPMAAGAAEVVVRITGLSEPLDRKSVV